MAVDTLNSPRIALIGGGYTLARVAALLEPKSFVITSRSEDTCMEWRQQGWIAQQVDILDQKSITEFFRSFPSISVIVDSVPPMRSGDPAAGVHTLLRAIPEGAIQRLLYLSTTGVFGVRDGSEVSEATPPAPWNPQGEARRVCEEVYRERARREATFHVTTLRLPAIYGPDRGVLQSIRAGTYSIVGDGSQWTNRIHVDDLARVIALSVNYQGVLPPVMCVSDDAPTRARDMVSYICEKEKLPFPPSVSAEEIERRGAYTMLSNQRVRNDLMKRVLGIALQYPTFREGLYPHTSHKEEIG